MSVEKMSMMNLIGDISYVDNLLRDLLFSEKISLVNALSQIEESSFVFNIKDENLEKAIDFNFISGFTKGKDDAELLKKGEELSRIFNMKPFVNKSHKVDSEKLSSIATEIESVYEEVYSKDQEVENLKIQLNNIKNFHSSLFSIKDFDVPIESLRDLKYFDFTFGLLSKDDINKLKKNYENILATVLHTGSTSDGEAYLIIYPSILKEELKRILRSLNWRELEIPLEYTGKANDILNVLDIKESNILENIKKIESELELIKGEKAEIIESLLNLLHIKEKIDKAKEQMAKSSKFFYISAWISENDQNYIDDLLKGYSNLLIIYKSESEVTNIKPPTKLNNNFLFKPFESLVKMYGVPAYNELDPTSFLSITYMLLFGAMFGDLGQGAIIFLGGLFITKKMGNNMFGGILSRIGVSSMIFGTLYGSFFGFENVIPALLIRPFENINTILISAIATGILLLIISYIYGMINCYKRRDLEEGFFGKEGLAGFLLYITLLVMGGGIILKNKIIPTGFGVSIIILSILAMIFRQPLTHLIQGKRPLHSEDISGYYIEGTFMIMETLLSILSGSVSFIRVGAFAISHVGLFMAFEAMAKMVGTPVGSAVVLIFGNILVIALDGLIVFIQGLRLQYYELFSRYYRGDGVEFEAMKLNN